MKRYLSFLLILAIIISSTVSMAAPDNRERELNGILDNILEVDMLPEEAEKVDFVLDENVFDEDDDVRIVVQLKNEPAISHTQRNVEKYAELSEGTKANLENNVLKTQNSLQNELSTKGINIEVINSVTVAANAFSSIVKGHEIEDIKNHPNVKNVFIANEYNRPENPQMATSHDMIGSSYAWDTKGYKGENMLVAIIDTGIDPSHKDMKISDGVKVKLNQKYVNALELPGTYRTNKVPYGYNYFDKNEIILDTTTRSHGMHVAGTVGANGNIKGVAPEAQLLAMKVFSNDPKFESTYDDIYMKAIDDAIKLGVDVINMSLGGPASFYQQNSAMDEMITNARNHGVIFSISAGNSAHSTNGYGNSYPNMKNPDIGMVGAPSLNKDSISVASIENTHSQVNYIAYEDNKKAPYSLAGNNPLAGKFKDIEFVDVGFGNPKDFEGKDLVGKVALISRGEIAFTDKIENAEKAGAAIAIVYNNAGNELINMAYPDNGKIPAAFIGNTYGVELKALEDKLMSFPSELLSAPNPNAYQMAGSTSWGTTPTLDMKPEITTPGGQIFSTLESNTYGVMSGTSMAAPHLSGGAALVLQYLKNEFPNMSTEELSEFSKTILMNTAIPAIDEDGELYSPRRQGAGLMSLPNALTTPVTVVNKADGEAKVQLKDFANKVINMNLLATNHSDSDVSYEIQVDVIADYIYPALSLNLMASEPLSGAKVSGDTSVSLSAGETKEICVTVDITNAIIPGLGTPIKPNMFVEGFIRLVAPTHETIDETIEELYPSLIVPYVGFYGDWFGETSPRIIDGMARFGETAFFGTTSGIVNQKGTYMGYDPAVGYTNSKDRLAISPSSELEKSNTSIVPVLAFLRNSEEIQFNVLDESGKQIRKIKTENWARKQYSNPQGIWYSYVPNRGWDGKINNQVAPDGQYFYQIKAKPQNGEWQVQQYPVFVDTVAPEISELKYSEGKLTWEAEDIGIGLSHFVLTVGDTKPTTLTQDISGKYELAIEIPEKTEIVLTAEDYAGNISEQKIKSSLGQKASIEFEEPEPFSLYAKNSIDIKGSVKAEEGLKTLIAYITPDGDDKSVIEVNIEVDKDGKFNTTVKDLVDAVYTIRLVATDNSDQKYDIFRYFHVDTTAPTIKDINVDVVDAGGETINKQMLGGGVSIVIPHLKEAYHRDYLGNNTIAKNKYNQAIAQGKDVYVKLADNIFVDRKGELVTQDKVPALNYYNAKGFVEKYDGSGNYVSVALKTANFKIEVEENHGYFEVYVNGSQEYIQSESGLMERKPFDGTIKFSMDFIEDTNQFEVMVKDQAGNQTIKNISIQSQ